MEFFINTVEKLWGAEGWIENDDRCYKLLLLNRGYCCSLHYHRIKSESFKVLRGTVFLSISGREMVLELGDEINIPPGHKHRFSSISDTSVILETSTHHDDSDTYRIENSKIDELRYDGILDTIGVDS